MFYRVKDIMAILGIAQTKAYDIIRDLGNDLAKTKIPSSEKTYCKPPAGRIQKAYFCERYKLDVNECDQYIQTLKGEQTA